MLRGDPPAAADADLVAAGARAGLVSVGTLNMTEFAYSGIGLNPHYGTPRNPNGTGPARAPGGSSSACGVAVASGLLPLAIGTDTGGSIRIPASFNGVTGYKSSTGHYSMRGVFPLSRTLDSLGPLAHSVADCVLADAVLRGLDSPLAVPLALDRVELVVPDQCRLRRRRDRGRRQFRKRAAAPGQGRGHDHPQTRAAVRRDPFAERGARSVDCRRGAACPLGQGAWRRGRLDGRARGEAHPGGRRR